MSVLDKVLGGITALLIILIVGAVFGRLHGSKGGLKPIGDRVACGLFALPLISLAVRLAFPSAHLVWALLLAPLPLAIYVVLLAGTDCKWKIAMKHFTCALTVGVMGVYVLMVLGVLIFHI